MFEEYENIHLGIWKKKI